MITTNPNKIVTVASPKGYPYFHIHDENNQPLYSANRYLDHLFNKGIRYNTIKAQALTISNYIWFSQVVGIPYDDLSNFRNRFEDIISDYIPFIEESSDRKRSTKTLIKRIRRVLESLKYFAKRQNNTDSSIYIQSLLDDEYKCRPNSPYEERIQTRYEPITPKNFSDILSACTNLRDRIILKLMHDTGIRKGELLTLRWQDLTPEKNRIVINGAPNLVTKAFAKTGYREIVAMGDIFYLLGLYKEDLENNGRLVSDYIFISLVGEAKEIGERAIKTLLNALSSKTGINLHSQRFRKTCAYNMKKLGIPLDVISAQLGHVYTSTTVRYYLGIPWNRKYEEIISRNDEYIGGDGI